MYACLWSSQSFMAWNTLKHFAYCLLYTEKQSASFMQLSIVLPEDICMKLGFHKHTACRIHSPQINSESGHSEDPKNRSVFKWLITLCSLVQFVCSCVAYCLRLWHRWLRDVFTMWTTKAFGSVIAIFESGRAKIDTYIVGELRKWTVVDTVRGI